MNKIVKSVSSNGQSVYRLTTENGQEFDCSRWFEKKTGVYHVKVPKEGVEICGRTYIRESKFDDEDVYEFETKTEHRTGLVGGGWRSKMTEEEKVEMTELEDRIEQIKSDCMKRETVKVDPKSEEGIELAIKKLMRELELKRSKK